MGFVLRSAVKTAIHASFTIAALPFALLAGFGKIRALFTVSAHICSLVPGLPGDYFRAAYYRLTLAAFPPSSRISFGSFFAHPDARVGPGVYIGSYCILGRTEIGASTQIASGVQVLSGQHQHVRAADGRITGSDEGVFRTVTIGRDCWIGAAAIVMANVGAGTTIGAGSVVTREIPENSVAVGAPARVISSAPATVASPQT